MYSVALFFVSWNNPEDGYEFVMERDNLEDIDIYNVSMVDAANIVKEDLPLDTTFNMLRCVKCGEEILEIENACLSTGSKEDDPIVSENLQGVKEILRVIDKVAVSLEELEKL